MSKVGLHNYEEFFIDYHEGNLSPDQMKELESFVLMHPELQEEFDLLGDAKLTAPKVRMDNDWVNSLKKPVTHSASDDDKLVELLEGDLDEAERDQLMFRIENEEALKREWSLIKSVQLSPEAINYPNKKELKAGLHCMPAFMESKLEGWNNELKLKADTAIVYAESSALKRSVRVVPLFNRVVQFTAAAAAVLLVWMIWPDQSPTARRSMLSSNDNTEWRVVNTSSDDLNEQEGSTDDPASTNSNTNTVFFAHEESAPIKRNANRDQAPSKLTLRSHTLIAQKDHEKQVKGLEEELETPDEIYYASAGNTDHLKPAENNVLTLGQFAKQKLNQTLVQAKEPEEGLILALLDRTAEKISENTATQVDLDVHKASEGEKGKFRLSIGKLEIRR